jgi:transposase
MIDMLKRHEIQVLRRADHTWSEIAALSGVSEKTARRIATEDPVSTVDNAAERVRRHVGRPSKAEAYREVLVKALTEDPDLRSVELLHRARQAGYTGGKSAVYALAQTLRVRTVTPLVRFEGLAGEFSQHDFGEVWVTYQDGTEMKVHFFASRLKYSRWIEVSPVPDERVETLVRALVEHLAAFGGIPLVTVFDRPKTIALSGDAMASLRNGIRRLPGWRSISASASRCAGRIGRRRKAVSRIWLGGSKTRSSSSAASSIAPILSGSCASGSPRRIRFGRRARPEWRRPHASKRIVPGCVH